LANKEFHRKEQNWHKQNFEDTRCGTRLRKEEKSIRSNKRENEIKGFRLISIA